MDPKTTVPFASPADTKEAPSTIPFGSTLDNPIVTLSGKDLDERAAKNHVALGEKSPGPYELRRLEELGHLGNLVNEASYAKGVADMNRRVALVTEIANAAGKAGRPLSSIESEVIMGLSSAELNSADSNPEVFLQQEYAKRVTDAALARGVDNPLEWDPRSQEFGFQVAKNMETFVAKKEIATRLAQDARAKAQEQGWLGYGIDVAKEFFPFYTWTKMKDAVEDYTGKDTPVTSVLPGSNLREQISYLYSLPPEQMHKLAKATIEGLTQDNPQLAARFAEALTGYEHESLDNTLIAGTDVLTLGLLAPVKALVKGGAKLAAKGAATGVVKGAPALADGASRLAANLKPVIQALTKREPSTASIADAMGDVAQSALQSTRSHFERGVGNDIKSMRDLDNQIASTMNPMSILEGPTYTLSREAAERVVANLTRFKDDVLSKLIRDPIQVDRLGPSALAQAAKETFETFSRQYRRIEDVVLDVELKNTESPTMFVRLGKNDSQLFDTQAQAHIYAQEIYGLPNNSYTVSERLGGAFIELERPMDITSKGVKNARKQDIKLDATPTPDTAIGHYLTKLRSAEDVLPQSVRESFKRAVYGGSALLKSLTEQAKIMGKVKNPEDFMSFLKYQQTKQNATDPTKLGHFSRTIGEFEIEWASRFNRLPTENEVNAYFAYTAINNTHYAFVNMSYWLDKTSRGLMDNFIPGLSRPVEGRNVKSLPTIKDEPATVLVLEDGKSTIYNTRFNTTPFKGETEKPHDYANRLISERGYQITQVSETGQMALKEMAEVKELGKKAGRIQFIVSKSADSKPLSYMQIPYRPGGHHMMPDGFFIRQPQVFTSDSGRRVTYYGDTNILHAPNEQAAKKMAHHLNSARAMLKETFDSRGAKLKGVDPKQVTALEAYVKANLPMSFKEFKKMFTGKDALLDPNAPIMYSASDASLDRAHDLKTLLGASEYQRSADSQYNLYRGMANMQYALERGDTLREAYFAGTKENPILGIRPGSLLDPVAAMERSMSSMRNGAYLETLRNDTAERFLAEFSDLLDLSNNKFRNDPFLSATSAPFLDKRALSREQLVRLNQAEAFRDRFTQFLGFRNKAEERVAYLADKVLNGTSPDLAQGWRKSLYEVLSTPDPVSKFKELAFHYKIGLFNPKHLLLQANTLSHTIGIVGPKIGLKSGLTAMVQNIVMHSPGDLTEQGAKIISKLGWASKEEFLESTNAFLRSGYGNVGREVATREQHARARIVTTKVGDVLDHGTWFFKKGEEFMRRSSWNAAYLEWRQANPTAKLTDNVISKLLDRADLLNVNMSQASNAAWQQGALSVPTQFMSYPVRLTEQLLGKRLTAAEKRSLMGTYAALYGVPVTTAIGSFGLLPSHNVIKEMALANQIDIEDNMILNVMNEGILGLLADGVFWEDNNFNVKYGPYGQSVLSDILSGDKNGFEMLMGASGSVLGEQIAAVAPVVPWIWRAVNPYADDNPPLSLTDFTTAFSPISSFSSAQKWIIAMKTGEYQTRKGYVVDEGNEGLRSFFYSFMGLQPQRIDDMYALMGSRKDRQEFVSKIQDMISTDFEKMLKATSQDDAEYYHKRILARQAMLEPGEQSTAIRYALRGRKSLMESQILYHKPKSNEEQDFNNNLYRKWMKNNNGAE